MSAALPFPCRENVLLSEHATLRLGGPARWFAEPRTLDELRAALSWAAGRGVRAHILGGGSNTLFLDAGFEGLVVRPSLLGVSWSGSEALVAAGESWDAFTALCVEKGLAGVECLSGIPGSVGAAPIQNVGAYGQEVGETLRAVKVLDRTTLEERSFAASECRLGYRRSRFKAEDQGRFVVTEVSFKLREDGRPKIAYSELARRLEGSPALPAVREAVLALRRSKGMLLDLEDPDSVSAGSFFTNPVLSSEALEALKGRLRGAPQFPAPGGVKLSAAWLVEQAGFPKGTRRGGAGVSGKHALALVNHGGTAAELLALAAEIREGVFSAFGVRLELEPSVVG
ncbi:MAG TPA: UDP-N-acetylenolpyruvoylglucosamine reductase [Elusimicrobia bacterium]|nr:UDP-N-acetylenolpyruvoylglucosamine reductase [Elusimicrobiota bacterium]